MLTPQEFTDVLIKRASQTESTNENLQDIITNNYGNSLITSPLAVSTAVRKNMADSAELSYAGKTSLEDSASSIEAGTQFNIMSISKLFTGAMLANMADEGKIDLDANLRENVDRWAKTLKEKYEIPEEHKTVFETLLSEAVHPDATIRDLAGHTSGMPRNDHLLEDSKKDIQAGPFKYLAVDEVSLVGRNEKGESANPSFDYSNMGYRVLGMIMEAEDDSSRDFSEMMREDIIDRYDLRHTMTSEELVDVDDINRPEIADWYAKDFGASEGFKSGMASQDSKDFTAAEGMISTPEDLTKFIQSLKDDGTLDIMLPERSDGQAYAYGLGLVVREYPDGQIWAGHEGGGSAVNTDLEINLKSGDAIAFTQTHVEDVSTPLIFERHALLDIKPEGVSMKIDKDEIPEMKRFVENRMNEILEEHGLEKDTTNINSHDLEKYLPAIEQIKYEIDEHIERIRQEVFFDENQEKTSDRTQSEYDLGDLDLDSLQGVIESNTTNNAPVAVEKTKNTRNRQP